MSSFMPVPDFLKSGIGLHVLIDFSWMAIRFYPTRTDLIRPVMANVTLYLPQSLKT